MGWGPFAVCRARSSSATITATIGDTSEGDLGCAYCDWRRWRLFCCRSGTWRSHNSAPSSAAPATNPAARTAGCTGPARHRRISVLGQGAAQPQDQGGDREGSAKVGGREEARPRNAADRGLYALPHRLRSRPSACRHRPGRPVRLATDRHATEHGRRQDCGGCRAGWRHRSAPQRQGCRQVHESKHPRLGVRQHHATGASSGKATRSPSRSPSPTTDCRRPASRKSMSSSRPKSRLSTR